MLKYIKSITYLLTALLLAFAVSCGTSGKVKRLHTESISVKMSPTVHTATDSINTKDISKRIQEQDTVKIKSANNEEKEIVAYRTEDGEIYAEDVLDAVIVESTFKNVAERNGKVDLSFNITVPKELQDSRWQVRFYPYVEILGEKEDMDMVFITGSQYNKEQLKGYEQYERFLSRIISDTTLFIDIKKLETFIRRNMPNLYTYKSDSTIVEDNVFNSYFGVTEEQAIKHYTNKFQKKRNEKRKKNRERMFAKYVKVPFVQEGVRLDTVMTQETGEFVYTYVQPITTRPKLKKAQISMIAEVYESNKQVYKTPTIGPIDFYISSISSFLDNETVRYVKKVVERRATDNKEYKIDFKVGKSDLDPGMGNNAEEVSKVKKHLVSLLDNKEFDLDSIIVSAAASPEGTVTNNYNLSNRRSIAMTNYFKKYVNFYKDSLARALEPEEEIFSINLDSTFVEEKDTVKPVEIVFTPRPIGEDWERLGELIYSDTTISQADKDKYAKMFVAETNKDSREIKMRSVPSYNYVKKELYPSLRNVKFKFFMHRKGMVKDTIHTSEIDTVYAQGVQALKDMDYERAIVLLGPYQDYNTAVTYTSMGRNISALQILEKLEKNAQVNYLLSIISAREGKIQDAVNYYLEACRMNGSYIHRGNLDPEISELIKKYQLHEILYKEEEEMYY